MYQFQPFAAIISPFALSTCNWPLTLWCCCCWGPRTMVEGDVDILQMMWSWCDPLKASLQLHWPIIRRPRSMLRVTPLMLHHYCPSLWCDHVRVGKLSASPPPPLSLPLSEWVWRDHEPSFTQLLRCRVQVQDPEIISSKIIWASPKNTFTEDKFRKLFACAVRRRLITPVITTFI